MPTFMTTIDRVSELEVKWSQVNTSVIRHSRQFQLTAILFLPAEEHCLQTCVYFEVGKLKCCKFPFYVPKAVVGVSVQNKKPFPFADCMLIATHE
ncbi:hypothetical protein T10_10073 [Trichinella papuae]|uniref:Uncharacterized protein n=1 Tax=Trichinella papuae TaxID=268474 RepID=A0A0V1N5S3_9BILA|nr:hypothetical protein T10_10073 [Trichinella papuae]